MAENKSLTIEEFKQLCDYDGTKYVQKSGVDYINSLEQIYELKNKNDRPFTIEEVKRQPLLKDFAFPGVQEFDFVCKLQIDPLTIANNGKKKNEKIIPFAFQGETEQNLFEKTLGVTYILTCVVDGAEHIIKIGSTRKTFKERLQSYNCGTVSNWRTASTTNIKIVQSFVATRGTFCIYLRDCGEAQTYVWHGVESVPFASNKAAAYEDILVKEFIRQFGKKPLANVQADATSSANN